MLQENSFFSRFKEKHNALSAKREKEANMRVKKAGASTLSRCEADTCKRGHIFYAVCELLVKDSNTLPKYFPFT